MSFISEINPNGLYKCTNIDKYYMDDPAYKFHCKNWTFKVVSIEDEYCIFCDTYFGTRLITVHENELQDFELIFDFNDVCRISEGDYSLYDSDDVYQVAIDSGGYTFPKYYKKKDAKVSQNILVSSITEEIKRTQNRLSYLQTELELAISGEHYKLK